MGDFGTGVERAPANNLVTRAYPRRASPPGPGASPDRAAPASPDPRATAIRRDSAKRAFFWAISVWDFARSSASLPFFSASMALANALPFSSLAVSALFRAVSALFLAELAHRPSPPAVTARRTATPAATARRLNRRCSSASRLLPLQCRRGLLLWRAARPVGPSRPPLPPTASRPRSPFSLPLPFGLLTGSEERASMALSSCGAFGPPGVSREPAHPGRDSRPSYPASPSTTPRGLGQPSLGTQARRDRHQPTRGAASSPGSGPRGRPPPPPSSRRSPSVVISRTSGRPASGSLPEAVGLLRVVGQQLAIRHSSLRVLGPLSQLNQPQEDPLAELLLLGLRDSVDLVRPLLQSPFAPPPSSSYARSVSCRTVPLLPDLRQGELQERQGPRLPLHVGQQPLRSAPAPPRSRRGTPGARSPRAARRPASARPAPGAHASTSFEPRERPRSAARKSDRIVRTTATRPPDAAAACSRLAKNAARALLELGRRLVILRPVGEDLLELIDDDHQPRLGGRIGAASGATNCVQRRGVPPSEQRTSGLQVGRRRASDRPGRANRAVSTTCRLPRADHPPAARSRSATARSPRSPPPLSLGISPASTTDDFPLPDGPSTARSRTPCGARTSRRRSLTSQPVRFSRPKKNRASSGPNASSPR